MKFPVNNYSVGLKFCNNESYRVENLQGLAKQEMKFSKIRTTTIHSVTISNI